MKYFLSLGFLFWLSCAFAQKENPLQPRWDQYHNTAQAYALLEAWQEAYPDLTELYSIGETLQGTPLMMLEITNKRTGAAADKPAYYYDGNIHAGELTSAEVALHFAHYLLSRYATDERIKNLLDTRTIYIRPKFNPDGADLALMTPTVLRSTPRPYDEDFDGLLDEDPSNDLNGDGHITQMRMKNPAGQWKVSTDDPRLMVERQSNERGTDFYDIYSEGIDDDGDGHMNEDGIGGIDMNRNFPRNWGLESEQKGAGPYPLSEPETRATIEFISSHRNITGVFHGHTAGGFLFRLPSTTSWDHYNMADQRLILELSDQYAETTQQPVRPSYSNPRLHRHGTLISWSYWDFGVPAFVPEFWGGFGKDYDEDGRVSQQERLRWNDEHLDGAGFVNWEPYQHPQLGLVEIGGWKMKFTRQNPPEAFLQAEIEQYVPWMLWLAEISPQLAIDQTAVKPIAGDELVQLSCTVSNQGYLPTHITQRALDVNIAVPVRMVLELEGAELISGQSRTDLGHLPGRRDSDASSDRQKHLNYVIKITGPRPQATLRLISEKGGTQVTQVSLR